MASIAALLGSKFSEQQHFFDSSLKVRLKPLEETVKQNQTDIVDIRKSQAEQQRHIEELQQAIQNRAGSNSSTGAPSTVGAPRVSYQTSRPQDFGRVPRPPFTPTYIAIQGWAKGANRDISQRSGLLFNEAAAQRCPAYLFEKAGCLQHIDE
eukprot:7726179-Pyramimonas_sp.AAC.1